MVGGSLEHPTVQVEILLANRIEGGQTTEWEQYWRSES